MDAVAITVWLNSISIGTAIYFNDKVSSRMLPRVHTIANYTTAPLLLIPFHLIVMMLTLRAPSNGSPVNALLAIAQHLGLLVATLSLGVPLFAWLLFESVSITALGAFTIAWGRTLVLASSAILMIVLVPAMMALIVYRLVS